jgi:RimJ/RimL family protein N-acetyltransferase
VLHRDPEVVRFVGALDHAQAKERLQASEREWGARGHGLLAVLDRSSGRLLGRVGLRYWPQFQETEAGWLLRRDTWGRGYATEAVRACVDWGFATLPAPYITAMIHPENTRSIRVAQRLGFEPVREDVLLGDPVIVHSLERESWASLDPIEGIRPCSLRVQLSTGRWLRLLDETDAQELYSVIEANRDALARWLPRHFVAAPFGQHRLLVGRIGGRPRHYDPRCSCTCRPRVWDVATSPGRDSRGRR